MEHLIQDGGTGPELEEWVRSQPFTKLAVERDDGVYDALNRGFARAEGEIFAFLHCDEQYLPDTLRRVQGAFAARPETDLVVGDYLIVDEEGTLKSFHRATPLRRAMVLTDHLYDYTCAFFFRRELWEQSGGFGTEYRILGDADWLARVLQRRPRITYLHEFTSAFGLTGKNLSLHPTAREEEWRLRRSVTRAVRLIAPFLRRYRHIEKFLRGGYAKRPFSYRLYRDDETERKSYRIESPRWRHPWR